MRTDIKPGDIVYVRMRVESIHESIPHGTLMLHTVNDKGQMDARSQPTWLWDDHVLTARDIAAKVLEKQGRSGSSASRRPAASGSSANS